MTEEEWVSGAWSGRLLEFTKRIPQLSAQVRGRKYRLAAVEMLRAFLPADSAVGVLTVLNAAEQLCAGAMSLRDARAVYAAAEFPRRIRSESNWRLIAAALVEADSFVCAREIAGATQSGPGKTPAVVRGLPSFHGVQCRIIRDVFGNPFRPVAFSPEWRTDTAVSLARGMYETRDFSAMPILADALQDAGCDSDDVLYHCRDANAAHVRGCWAVDLVLGMA